MARTIGRRAAFFAAASLVCVALVPAAPAEFRWVAWATAALGGFWAVLMSIEDLLGRGRGRRVAGPPRPAGTPFDPPPAPGEGGDQESGGS